MMMLLSVNLSESALGIISDFISTWKKCFPSEWKDHLVALVYSNNVTTILEQSFPGILVIEKEDPTFETNELQSIW